MYLRELAFSARKEVFLEDINVLVSLNASMKSSVFLYSKRGYNVFSFLGLNAEFFNNSTFYISANLRKHSLFSILVSNLKIFLKGLNQGFFVEFRIIGLGFRVKKSGFLRMRSLKFDIGYSHVIRLVLPSNIKLSRVKRRFFIYTNDNATLNIFLKQIKELKKIK